MSPRRDAPDTLMGGAAERFPSTLWSQMPARGAPTPAERRARLDALLRRYWRPVYASVRRSWGASVEDAKDLTQAFFSRLLETDAWAGLDPGKGSFRGWLRTALRHFLLNARDAERARRPEAGFVFSLDVAPDELERIAPAAGPDPDAQWDRDWFRCVMDDAIRELEATLSSDGRALSFAVFEAYCLGESDPGGASRPTYVEVGDRLGLGVTDVRHRLSATRELLRALVLRRIREYAPDDAVEAELARALGS